MSSTPHPRKGTSRRDAGSPVNGSHSPRTPHQPPHAAVERELRRPVPSASTTGASHYIPTATYGSAHRSSRPHRGTQGRADGGGPNVTRRGAIALFGVATLGASGFWFVNSRPVLVKVNGQEMKVAKGATLEQVGKAASLSPNAGNLVSVSGRVLEQGKGHAFSARVNDADLDQGQIDSYRAKAGDDIQISDGADQVEEYAATTREVQPKLLMQGGYGAVAYVSQWGRPGRVETRTGVQSKETADATVEEVRDCIVFLHNVKPDNDQKLVALTFDDGPSEYTQRYLDILNQYGARATFFSLGSQIAAYPELSKAVVAQGSQVASHSYTHPELPGLDQAALQEELGKTFDAIRNTDGVSTTMIRPPYGAFKESTWLKSGGLLSCSVLWNQDSEDWRRPGAEAIASNALSGIAPGSIILMHDGGGNRDQDIEALPTIISSLQGQGYTLVTLNELLASDSSIPDDIKTGNATLPEGCVWPTEIGDA